MAATANVSIRYCLTLSERNVVWMTWCHPHNVPFHSDTELQTHWWGTIDFPICVGHAGIVLNAEKFYFARIIVDFAGFRISDETIEPLPKYMDATRDFPTPTSTTDIRSWFGLVNQVANYAQLHDIMAPFKHLYQPKVPIRMDTRT